MPSIVNKPGGATYGGVHGAGVAVPNSMGPGPANQGAQQHGAGASSSSSSSSSSSAAAAGADPSAPLPAGKVKVQGQLVNLRKAGQKVWEDKTLDEWPESDFRIFCGDLGELFLLLLMLMVCWSMMFLRKQ